MKKFFLIGLILLGGITSSYAQNYRGFIETGTIVNFKASGISIPKGGFTFTTTHGYLFNPYVFLGGGIGVDYHSSGGRVFIPIFADFRTYFTDSNIAPFFDTKVGYSIGKKESDVINPGVYFSPSIGLRFNIGSSNKAMNLAVGYNMQQQVYGYTDYYYHYYYDYYEYFDYKLKYLRHGLSIKLGVEF
ncbi:MAG: hypothetical protein IJY36_03295 [Coprobacter sp.]|nr:hypothetical protein [Coprobacter sp.]